MMNNDDNPKDLARRVEKMQRLGTMYGMGRQRLDELATAREIGEAFHTAWEASLRHVEDTVRADIVSQDFLDLGRHVEDWGYPDPYADLASRISVADEPDDAPKVKHAFCRTCGHSETYERFVLNGCRTDFCRCGPDGIDIVTRMMKS